MVCIKNESSPTTARSEFKRQVGARLAVPLRSAGPAAYPALSLGKGH